MYHGVFNGSMTKCVGNLRIVNSIIDYVLKAQINLAQGDVPEGTLPWVSGKPKNRPRFDHIQCADLFRTKQPNTYAIGIEHAIPPEGGIRY